MEQARDCLLTVALSVGLASGVSLPRYGLIAALAATGKESLLMKEVVVQLAPRAVAAPKGSPLQAAFETAKNFGLTLEAMHPQSDDPVLSRWFHAEVDNAKVAEFVETLRNIPEVTAAYVKPPAEAP